MYRNRAYWVWSGYTGNPVYAWILCHACDKLDLYAVAQIFLYSAKKYKFDHVLYIFRKGINHKFYQLINNFSSRNWLINIAETKNFAQ